MKLVSGAKLEWRSRRLIKTFARWGLAPLAEDRRDGAA